MTFDQSEFDIRCEWGLEGLRSLAPISDALVIVDVLSFTTAMDIAASRGAVVLPYPLRGEAAAEYARTVGAELASPDRGAGFSLSPASLRNLPAGYRLVLPSPNGGALAFAAEHPVVAAACLRNAAAVAGGTGKNQGTVAGSINAAGVIAGYYDDAKGKAHGFVRASDGTFTVLNASRTGTGQTFAVNIDNGGAIAGYYTDLGVARGFLRSVGGQILRWEIPGAGGGTGQGTYAIGINGSRTVTGYYLDSNFVAHSYVRFP